MAARADAQSDAMVESRQCVVVTANSWSSAAGTLRLFERERNSSWRQLGTPVPVLLGRRGLAWGRGAVKMIGFPGPLKTEGDDKAPAGIFRLGSVFGYARDQEITTMPYVALSKDTVAVDDPGSRYYNQIIDRSKTRDADWRSAEQMILSDDRYKWGVFVEHNIPPIPGAGSCVFLHIWKDRRTPTSGCTAMAEEDLLKLIRWLKPDQAPLLVQLPKDVYNKASPKWNLPKL
jgi:L,D-peptidoglycan transpeptidase YkuD (ErfK/YbiS/YcfS/YnhG family)